MSVIDATNESDLNELAFHAMPIDEVFKTLNVDPSIGLPLNEVKQRREAYGPNAIPKVRGSIWQIYIAPILNWLITIYLISSFALVFLAYEFPDSFVNQNPYAQASLWLGVVFINCIVAIFQQVRAQKKLEALEKLSEGEARVLRNGVEVKVHPIEIVPGDIVKLEQGDKIPADGRIITCSNFTANEASLTGESVPVSKIADVVVDADVPLTDMMNTVFFGTYVATGNATFVVTKIGGATEIGKIQGELEQLNTGDIPLRKKVNLLAKYLAIAAVCLMAMAIVWPAVVGPLLGYPFTLSWPEAFSIGIIKAMTIMPINIPLLTTIVLLTGVLAMARKGVIIRDLSAVESLGRVSVICSDKTGTMTKNEMTVKYVWDLENLYYVSGDGYSPSGEIFRLHDSENIENLDVNNSVKVTDILGWRGLYRVVVSGGINNDSAIEQRHLPDQGTVWIPIGDPTDAALLTLFRKSGLNEEQLRTKYRVVKDFPFDSELKRMSKICVDGDKFIVFTKGATEILLPRCTKLNREPEPVMITETDVHRIQQMADSFAERGYRVISLAYKRMDTLPMTEDAREIAETNLIYLGLVCIVDPPREGVREAVAACHSAGISVVMITGDSATTAKTIAEELGIYQAGSLVVEGNDIELLSDENFERVNVYARVNPAHKQVIVERYQERNKVVGMTGDGVNDALALAMSDVGIAMGITGTDVAKEAADLVITDDSFASIVTGVRQGRGLISKIRMMIYFYVAINLFESLIFFGSMIFLPGIYSILTTWQALYLIVTTHSFPGLALVFDKISPGVMKEKPRDSEELITRPLARFMALHVFLMAIGAGTLYAIVLSGWLDLIPVNPVNLSGYYPLVQPFEDGSTIVLPYHKAAVMLLSVFLIVESWVALLIRRINMPLSSGLREPGIGRFIIFLGLIYLAHLLLMYNPVVSEILASHSINFYFIPLSAFDWLWCILFSLPPIVGIELYKLHLRRKGVFL